MSLKGLFHLIVIYIVWGSTYLAIRIAVKEGAGFPPFTMAGTRVICAAAILLLWARLAGARIRITRKEATILIAAGVLLWLGGNGLVAWAEQRADSGYAALLVGTMPLSVAIMESLIDRRKPTFRLIGALLVGLAGLAVLNGPLLMEGAIEDLYAAIALISATIFWGYGSIMQRRNPVKVSSEVHSGYQQLFGGMALLIAALLAREPVPTPTPQAWGAWSYLILFGSVFAFTSFVRALRLLPTNIVMTYAYVNPVVAVFLGWLILREPVTWWTLGGTVLIVLGVAGVFHERGVQARRAITAQKTQ
jgi:drug/metabolite transporter (DMT)-like permease